MQGIGGDLTASLSWLAFCVRSPACNCENRGHPDHALRSRLPQMRINESLPFPRQKSSGRDRFASDCGLSLYVLRLEAGQVSLREGRSGACRGEGGVRSGLEAFVAAALLHVFREIGGMITAAANRLGIPRTTLNATRKKLAISCSDLRPTTACARLNGLLPFFFSFRLWRRAFGSGRMGLRSCLRGRTALLRS